MKFTPMHMRLFLSLLTLIFSAAPAVAAENAGKDPAENLPPWIRQVTWFGERADFSHDGKKILFLEHTYGDAVEVELSTGIIRPVTHHFHHGGFLRALYLANGDILLVGPKRFDPDNPGKARAEDAEMWIVDKSLKKKPVRLGEKCAEGPAVSRTRMRIAWTITGGTDPDRLPKGASQMWMGDIVEKDGALELANKKLIADSRKLPFQCSLETQNFIPPAETALTFSAYGYNGTDVCGIDLATGAVTEYSKAPNQYDEPEGIFPDGKSTLVESDRQNRQGPGHVDIWKLALDGSGKMERLTFFSDYPGYKASNPVVSDDGRYMAFQMAKADEPAGVGHGIFIYDFEKMRALSSK